MVAERPQGVGIQAAVAENRIRHVGGARWGVGGKGHSLRPHVAHTPSPRLPSETGCQCVEQNHRI